MRSEAATVNEYLAELPDERREAIEAVRRAILDNLPRGYEEVMNWGMICYQVPLETYPDTYNGKPLMYAGLASQKNHMALYLTSVYAIDGEREAFEAAYRATGKRLDMGASCVRFRKLDDLPLDLVASTIAAVDAEDFVEHFEAVHPGKRG
ncbi:MAG: DUF1801 domain-containing protein [Acidimicrobiia bacterium]